jgi:hypothetical protein
MISPSNDLLHARIYALIPQSGYISASVIADLYEARFHEQITVKKCSLILDDLFSDGLILMRKKRRNWGFLSTYGHEEGKEKMLK